MYYWNDCALPAKGLEPPLEGYVNGKKPESVMCLIKSYIAVHLYIWKSQALKHHDHRPSRALPEIEDVCVKKVCNRFYPPTRDGKIPQQNFHGPRHQLREAEGHEGGGTRAHQRFMSFSLAQSSPFSCPPDVTVLEPLPPLPSRLLFGISCTFGCV